MAIIDYRQKKFLVIDDQPMARESLRAIAQTAGAFAVDFAPGYQEAIFKIRNNTPDIILCDYMLGGGRSGQQLLEELRRFNLLPDETIFMMVTGEQSYEQVVAAVELVPDDYIIKPFSPDKLILRLDRVAAKKQFFAAFYREKRKQEYASALAILASIKDSEAGRAYRFESLRQEAEVHLVSGDAEKAETAYRNILERYEFPWARAGVAKSLHRQNRLTEAREEIDKVVAGTPHYFDAADLKANICMAQGEHAEAQKVLDEVAKKTPRNYLRKRLLAEAAELNGDIATAQAAMADVVANDNMPGAVSAEDQLTLARTHVGAGDMISAEKVLLLMRESEVMNLDLARQASFSALLAVASPAKGKPKFSGLRPALLASPLPTISRVDVLRAALTVDDRELADTQARQIMSGDDAKRVFGVVRKLYALQGREPDFREMQRQVALQRIHHDESTE
ncbi:MAG: response regulator [Betaproteobacteria bacterium]|jgi:DNA-binding response OmpR family regulator|nr:response regulator [Betaproteobacteria bacterium]